MPANYLCTIGLFGVYCLNRDFYDFNDTPECAGWYSFLYAYL